MTYLFIYTDIRILAEPICIEKGFNSIAFLEPIWHDAALALEGSPQKNLKVAMNAVIHHHTVAPVDMVNVPLFKGFYHVLYIQPVVVWDFWTINSRSGRANCHDATHLISSDSVKLLEVPNDRFNSPWGIIISIYSSCALKRSLSSLTFKTNGFWQMCSFGFQSFPTLKRPL